MVRRWPPLYSPPGLSLGKGLTPDPWRDNFRRRRRRRGSGGTGAAPFSLTFVTSASDATDLTEYTFSGQSFGDEPGAADTRYIIVGAGGRAGSNLTVSSATIGGVAATVVIASGATNAPAAIFIAEVPTGTTGDVVVTYSGAGMVSSAIGIWRMINPISSTATDTASDITPASGVLNLDLDVTAGGAAVGFTASRGADTTTWAGMTEAFDILPESLDHVSGATTTTAGTPLTVTATNADTTPSHYTGVTASWA